MTPAFGNLNDRIHEPLKRGKEFRVSCLGPEALPPMTTTPSSHLTAKVFAEYLQCKTKGQLLWRAPQSQNAHFTNVYCNRIKSDSADRAEHSTEGVL